MVDSQGYPTPDELRALRQSAGLSRDDVARLLGYSASYIKSCELGRRRMRPLVYQALRTKIMQPELGLE